MAQKSKSSYVFLLIILAGISYVLDHFGLLPGVNNPDATNPPPATVAVGDLPKTPQSFSSAKRILYDEIYAGHSLTFYCGCRFDPERRDVDLASCGVTPRKNAKRAERIEAEHVMPAHHFGQHRQCWREPEKVCPRPEGKKPYSGRKCCEKSDPVFEAAHNDLHNLFPAVGEINGDRSNFRWGLLPNYPQEYGACAIKVDESIRRAEPPPAVRGDIARVYFYMEDTYGFRISDQQRQLFSVWSQQDPPDAWEQERNRRIAKIQGKDNRFISAYQSGANSAPPPASSSAANTQSSVFRCQPKKTCGEMVSCEEAKFHLLTCGNTRLDRDGDGIPCTSVCR